MCAVEIERACHRKIRGIKKFAVKSTGERHRFAITRRKRLRGPLAPELRVRTGYSRYTVLRPDDAVAPWRIADFAIRQTPCVLDRATLPLQRHRVALRRKGFNRGDTVCPCCLRRSFADLAKLHPPRTRLFVVERVYSMRIVPLLFPNPLLEPEAEILEMRQIANGMERHPVTLARGTYLVRFGIERLVAFECAAKPVASGKRKYRKAYMRRSVLRRKADVESDKKPAGTRRRHDTIHRGKIGIDANCESLVANSHSPKRPA